MAIETENGGQCIYIIKTLAIHVLVCEASWLSGPHDDPDMTASPTHHPQTLVPYMSLII